jgi:preprotein translocase subunit SecY
MIKEPDMAVRNTLSPQTRNNWMIDALLFGSAVLAALSGIYFLFFPTGGFQGGRNPWVNVQILFDRHTWDDLHTWGGVIMILVAVIHLVIHWSWFVSMARRSYKELTSRTSCLNARGRFNLWVNVVVAVSFVLTAVSGIYLLLVPGGPGSTDMTWLLTRTGWDLLHTWAGVVLILAAVIHFAIHWKWVTKVTNKLAAGLRRPEQIEPLAG